jgi:hypothetical protein
MLQNAPIRLAGEVIAFRGYNKKNSEGHLGLSPYLCVNNPGKKVRTRTVDNHRVIWTKENTCEYNAQGYPLKIAT